MVRFGDCTKNEKGFGMCSLHVKLVYKCNSNILHVEARASGKLRKPQVSRSVWEARGSILCCVLFLSRKLKSRENKMERNRF